MIFAKSNLRSAILLGVGEALVALGILWVAEGLAYLRLSAASFGGIYMSAVFGLITGRWLRQRTQIGSLVSELGVTVIAMQIAAITLPSALPLSGKFAVAFAMFGGVRAWRYTLIRTTAMDGRNHESVRRLIVAAAALWVIWPFGNARLLGGTDAFWYANMMRDFVEQFREGVFPIFLGQGEHAYNGGVHPFRSAPMYLWVGGFWDLVTGRSLHFIALQHLTAISAAFAAAFGMYACGVMVGPQRRYVAVWASVIYVCCPGILCILYWAEMYMTYMAFAVLPWVIFGNIRALERWDVNSYIPLAASLSLIWLCHPPVALMATVGSALMQGGGLLFGRGLRGQIKPLLIGAVWFVGLSSYYFLGMSELPPRPGDPIRADVAQICGLGLVVASFRGFEVGRRPWLGLAIPGFALLCMYQPGWAIWTATFGIITGGLAAWAQWRGTPLSRGKLGALAVGLAVLSAAILYAPLHAAQVGRSNDLVLSTIQQNIKLTSQSIWPISPLGNQITDYQPGWSVLFTLFIGAAGLIWSGAVAARWSAVVGLGLMLYALPLPLISEFFAAYSPPVLASIMGIPLTIRVLPAAVAFAIGGGLLVFAREDRLYARRPWLVAGGMALLALWSIYEAQKVTARGPRALASTGRTREVMAPENAVMPRFVYDLLPHPSYLSHGKLDPRLEVRFLDPRLRVAVGPDEVARRMEAAGATVVEWTSSQVKEAAEWVNIGPGFEVKPGERLLLRFEFNDANYSGYLVFNGYRSYRDYILPESGLTRGFGTGARQSKVLSFWNTGDLPEIYKVSMQCAPGSSVSREGGRFATVTFSRYDMQLSPLGVHSFIPYRAAVDASHDGWLETPRVYLPGYEVRLGGRPVKAMKSPEGLLMIPLLRGTHEIEVEYTGSIRIWAGLLISSLAWLTLAFRTFGGWRKRRFAS